MQRRLEHDAELRAEYERWHIASAALKRQPVRIASKDFGSNVRGALEKETPAKKSRGWVPWAAAASVALGLMVVYPQYQAPTADTNLATTETPGIAPATMIDVSNTSTPSLANADMVVDFSAPDAAPEVIASTQPKTETSATVAAVKPAQLPDTLDIPASKPWPKASVIANDPSMDAMLIRHNQMADAQGMNGFVPYVDVVADDEAIDSTDTQATDRNGEVRR